MIDGDESWLGPPSTISSSLPLPLPGILWTSMSWNGSADPSRWRAPCVTGSQPRMAVQPLFLPRRIDRNGVRRNRCLPLQCSRWHVLLEQGPPGLTHVPQDERAVLEKDLGKAPAGWDEGAFEEAASVIGLAQQLLTVDQSYFQEVVTLVRPFLHQVRHGFHTSGWIAFDGLLARAKTLLRDHPSVRDRIKQTYGAILVDEFQDTDPVQYEIILYLGERSGSHQTSWQDVDLEPGKLFIVGDPKQSIYAFRRADIEAFERVVEKIRAGGGGVYSLVTNFRSDGAVLEVVNNVFDRLFQPMEHVQPANERLVARPQRKPEVSVSGVQLRLVTPGEDDEEFDVQAATRAEAEALARWLKEELLAGTTVTDRDRRHRSTPTRPHCPDFQKVDPGTGLSRCPSPVRHRLYH